MKKNILLLGIAALYSITLRMALSKRVYAIPGPFGSNIFQCKDKISFSMMKDFIQLSPPNILSITRLVCAADIPVLIGISVLPFK